MLAGKLDRRITIQRATETRAAPLYEPMKSWATYATVWASKRPAGAREQIRARELGAEVDTVFQIRFSNDVRLVDPTFQIVHDGRTYQVTGALEIGRREGIELLCLARGEGGLPAFEYPAPDDYVPSLDYSDGRNSQYLLLLLI